jgi:PPM family protein phosphatase
VASENGTDLTAVRARPSHRAQPKRARRSGRRRWPIVTTSLVVLLAVIIGGGYIAWRWTQDQYYVGADSKGNVVIYRGVNQRIAGISLSRPYQQTGVKLAQVPSNDQQTVKTAYATGSLAEVQRTVSNVRAAVNQCKLTYTTLQDWVSRDNAYQAAVTQAKKQHKPTKGIVKPGPEPSRPAATCPQSAAFGIAASALVPAAGAP